MPVVEAERLKQFWETRYQRFSLSESGWLGAGEKRNEYLYACKAQALRGALKDLGLRADSHFSVLDAGCGQGFFADFYRSRFRLAEYTGVDISTRVVDHLRESFRNYKFFADDFTVWRDPDARRFDVIQSFEVLHLILDDDLVEKAMQSFKEQLQSRGHILMTAVLPDHSIEPNDYIRFRSRQWYEGLFARLGLEIIKKRPMYYWLPDRLPGNRYVSGTLHLAGPAVLYFVDRLGLALRLPRFSGRLDSRMQLLTLRAKVGQ
jgi:SAM-dependent methyltransferase